MLANLIIAGVNKAGSTSVFHYLESHPEVCGSIDKETCYFLPLLYDGVPGPIEEYQKQFSRCENQKYRLEATPAYVYGGEKIAGAIKKAAGNVKIILILREPVDRMISFYQRKKATLQLPSSMSFREYAEACLSYHESELDKLENQLFTGAYLGRYERFIEPWLKIFEDNIKVTFFDDLKRDPLSYMKELSDWLKIDRTYYDQYNFDIRNQSLNYKSEFLQRLAVTANKAGQKLWRTNPVFKRKVLNIYYKLNGASFEKNAIDQATREKLHNYFAPGIQQLYYLLSAHGIKRFPAWLQTDKHLV